MKKKVDKLIVRVCVNIVIAVYAFFILIEKCEKQCFAKFIGGRSI